MKFVGWTILEPARAELLTKHTIKNMKHRNKMRLRVRSIGKSGFRFSKSKSGFPNRTHPKQEIGNNLLYLFILLDFHRIY